MSLVPFRAGRGITLRAAVHSWFRGWTQGNLEDDNVGILQGESVQPTRKSHGWSPEEAIKYLIKAIKDEDVYTPGQGRQPRREPPHRLPYALFCDIDDRIFGGVLKGNVHLRFDQSFPSGLAGATIRPSQQEKRRITIELSRELVFKQRPRTIVEVLLHEMVHAYLLQCCGPQDGTNGHSLLHGADYSAVAFVVVMACGLRQFGQFPSLIGVIAQRRGQDDVERIESDRGSCYSEGLPFKLCQRILDHVQANVVDPQIDLDRGCPRDGLGIRRPITQYFHTFQDGRFTPMLRSSAKGLPVEFVELHYQDRAVPVAYHSAPRSLESKTSKSGEALVMPFVDDQAFNNFHRFLTNGTYAPSVGKRDGPPRIGQGVGVAEPLCLTDIRAYRLAASLGVPELQEYALKRLWSYGVTFEDPIAALDYLYHGPPQPQIGDSKGESDSGSKQCSEGGSKEKASGGDKGPKSDKAEAKGAKDCGPKSPDEALRAWARAWLRASNGEYGRNIDVLRRHASWSHAWKTLKAKGGPLIIDVDAVEEDISRINSEERLSPRRASVRIELQSPEIEARPVPWIPEMRAPAAVRLVRPPSDTFGSNRHVHGDPEILVDNRHRAIPLTWNGTAPGEFRARGGSPERLYRGLLGDGRIYLTDCS